MNDRAAAPLRVAAAAALVGGLAGFAHVIDQHYAIQQWLLWGQLRLLFWIGVFLASSLAIGWRLLAVIDRDAVRTGERAVVGLALGVFVFAWGVFAAGIVGVLGRVFFFVWP